MLTTPSVETTTDMKEVEKGATGAQHKCVKEVDMGNLSVYSEGKTTYRPASENLSANS
jgi:hypothetical protein